MENCLDISMLTHKKLRTCIREGTTTETLCTMYGCDEKMVDEKIDHLYSNNLEQGRKLKVQLAKNDKKARKAKRSDEAKNETEDVTSAADILATIVAKRDGDMKKLAKVELAQSNEVMKLEANNIALRNEITGCSERLGELGTEMRELIAAYNQKYEQFRTEVAKLNEAIEKRGTNLSKLSGGRTALDETRQKVRELKKLAVFAYGNGDIVVINGDNEVSIPEIEGSELAYRDLLASPDEYEDLRVKDIKTLARLIALRDISPLEIDLTCDVDEVSEAYHLLKSK